MCVFDIMNVIMTQRRIFYAIISMNVFGIMNALMVLEHVFHGVINVNIHMDKWWIAPKRYNTYGVVPRKPYINPE